jgi:Spy/CpxP family protein refolding chaperone
MLHTKVMACVLAGLVATTVIAAPPIAGAIAKSEHGRWAGSPLGRLISGHIGRLILLRSELNLTDEQRAKLKDTVAAKKPEIARAAKGVWEKRTALADAVLADQPDEQAIHKAADELGKVIGDAAVLASKVAGEVKPVLDAGQQAKWHALFAHLRETWLPPPPGEQEQKQGQGNTNLH